MLSLQFDDFCSYIFLLVFSSAVLRDPDKRFDYDLTGIYEIDKYTLRVRILILLILDGRITLVLADVKGLFGYNILMLILKLCNCNAGISDQI
jgi:hypothetical protein